MKTSRDDLILDNVSLIYYVLKKMNLYKNADEYYDIGMIGLIKAADTFNESKGYTFSTYGISCIRSELLGYIRRQNSNKRKANYNTISLEMKISSRNKKTKRMTCFFFCARRILTRVLTSRSLSKIASIS